jgi:hypothetical protein
MKVYIMDKKHDTNGNPVYKFFIPDIDGKVKGLRKLKQKSTYSTQSYNVRNSLEYSFPDTEIEIIDNR